MNFKRCFSFVLLFIFVLSGISSYALPAKILREAVHIGEETQLNLGFEPQDEVILIVEAEGDPVLASKEAAVFGTEFIDTPKGNEHEEALLSLQSDITEKINDDVTKDAEIISSYTLLFNGFSIKTTYENLEKIKNLPGVKNAYVDEEIKLTPDLTTSVEISGALPAEINSYSGKGQVIAVLDVGFKVNHELFSAAPGTVKYTENDILNLVKSLDLHASSAASEIYYNSKIPFKYDYAGSKNQILDDDDDGVSSTNKHGTHVAGIAGGKGGKYNDKIINGVAPECQLFLMKVADDDGYMIESVTIAALEDAVRLGADVVNYSISAKYTSVSDGYAMQQSFASARNAGVFLAVSAGNEARGFYKKTPLVENIDYGAMGIPSSFSEPTAVASAINTATSSVRMSGTSSYGVNDNLELKPEITAPGGGILSSVISSTTAYDIMSGTSMAAPHISGAAAIMYEYFDDKGILSDGGKNRVLMAENMLMSTASIIKNASGVPYSPRVQGAGLVNVSKALKTPAILIGNEEKCKISLGERLTNVLNINFKVQNLTDESVTYDKISVCALTDGYTITNGEDYVSNSVELEIKSDSLPESITIEAGSSAEISAKVILDNDWLKNNNTIFKNGFFIDGFISLEKTDDETLPEISIPFTGFYGIWAQATVFDKTIYDEGGSTLIHKDDNGNYYAIGTSLYTYKLDDKGNKYSVILGNNNDGVYDSKYIALSPNNDGLRDVLRLNLTPMRNIKYFISDVRDENNKTVAINRGNIIINKFQTRELSLVDISSFSDGEYTLILGAKFNYEDSDENMTFAKSIPFYIDTQEPEIVKAVSRGDTIEAIFKDNKYVSYVRACKIDENGEIIWSPTKFFTEHTEGGEYKVVIDLGSFDAKDLSPDEVFLIAFDMAENMGGGSVSLFAQDTFYPVMKDFTYSGESFNVDFDITSYKEDGNYNAILAFYDEDGTLIYLKSQDTALPNGESKLSFSEKMNIDGATECRLFIWDDMESIFPADVAKIFDIREMMQ